jgi:hypothetical protein
MAFVEIPDTGGDAITNLTGDVVANGPGSSSATIQNGVVTSDKLASAVSTDIANGLINDNSFRILKGLGADIKGLPFGPNTPISTPFLALADGYGYFTAVYIPQAATITGVKLLQGVQGNYVADNTNQVGLYSVSGTTATRVATSTNNGDLWKTANNTFFTVPFSATYSAAAGVYYVGVMRNSVSQTTGPSLALCSNFITSGVTTFGFTGIKLTWNQGSNTELQASYDISSAFNTGSIFWVALY